MTRPSINDLLAFLAVAKERSFTRAAAQLGVSQSALSHTVRGLEERLGLRLLTRTTRSVATTEAGERLLRTVGPRLEEIDAELSALTELRDQPAGKVRITAGEHSAEAILWPALAKLLPRYPDIKVELTIDYGLTDIVAERYDAGVRLGEQVAKDMIAVRIGPDFRMAVVGAPAYFAKHAIPNKPQDLTAHNCINIRLRAGTQGPGRGTACVQQHDASNESGARRSRPGISAGGPGADSRRRGTPYPRARRLVSAVFGLSPLLPKPPAARTGFCRAGRSTAASRITPPLRHLRLTAPVGLALRFTEQTACAELGLEIAIPAIGREIV
jgi:DNA-binding transcriptional LysR family regulator